MSVDPDAAPTARMSSLRFAGYGVSLTDEEWAVIQRKRTREAQDAFERGQDALAAGEAEEGFFWLSRSERLTGGCGAASFAAATAAMALGRLDEALPRLKRLRETYDLPEAAFAEALCLDRAARRREAGAVLDKALSRFYGDATIHALAGRLARQDGRPGWATLSNGSVLLLRCAGVAELSLDGVKLGVLPAGRHDLRAAGLAKEAEKWAAGQALSVCVEGRHVLGSPFDIRALTRCDSLVVPTENGLVGWAWHPAEPSFAPRLKLEKSSPHENDAAEHDTDVALTEEEPLAEGYLSEKERLSEKEGRKILFPATGRPLTRPRFFTLDSAVLPQDRVMIRDTHGRPLMGAPIAPQLGALLAGHRGQAPIFQPKPARFLSTLPADSEYLPEKLSVESAQKSFSKKEAPEKGAPEKRGLVIVPVYGGGEVTLACLESLFSSLAPDEAEIVVVDDATPVSTITHVLDRFAAEGRLTLLRNSSNLGFTESVNRGLRWALQTPGQRDVVLLNSDTQVFPGWFARLQAWLRLPGVGTATPFSNEGGQLSWPSVTEKNALPTDAEARVLDALCAELGDAFTLYRQGKTVALPTGNGFCMAISGACLAQTGLLRGDLFAQGYGEENDFCLRASALGFRHMAATDVYVRHEGGGSFGAARVALLTRNVRFVEALHPGYLAHVRAFEKRDPLAFQRRRLGQRWFEYWRAGETLGSVVLIQHKGGGGVARAVRERGARLAREGWLPLVLSPSTEGCVLELPEGLKESLGTRGEPGVREDVSNENAPVTVRPCLTYALPDDAEALVTCLRDLGTRWIEWHHLIGHAPWMRGLHRLLDVPYDVHIHDHVWFCPRIALFSPDGRYCGEPDEEGCVACVARGEAVLEESVASLRARSRRELTEARRVVAPSQDAARRLKRYFPEIDTFDVTPLQDDQAILAESRHRVRPNVRNQALLSSRPTSRPTSAAAVRVGITGGLSRWKGADYLLELARYVQARALPLELVLIGRAENDAALIEAGVRVSGAYREEDALALVRSAQLDIGFIPSRAPETWCYALEWLWRAGLEVICFDIGAVAERVRASGRGHVLPLGLPVAQLADYLLQIGKKRRVA